MDFQFCSWIAVLKASAAAGAVVGAAAAPVAAASTCWLRPPAAAPAACLCAWLHVEGTRADRHAGPSGVLHLQDLSTVGSAAAEKSY